MPKDDEAARRVHLTEQGQEGFRDAAKNFGIYFQALLDNGMTREEALAMTLGYQQIMLVSIMGQSGSSS